VGVALTTTMTELNRLYGLYHDAASAMPPRGIEISKAWFAYLEYVKKYNAERHIPDHLSLRLISIHEQTEEL
jgi:hypothetical protein